MPTDQSASTARDVVASAVSAPAKQGPTLRDMLEAQKAEIARALPMALDATRYVRIVQTELRKNPKLMKCEPRSFLGAVITAAQLGLEFGPLGQAYLVPFKNRGVDEVQLIIGYKGWLALAHRSGQIASIAARSVHQNDVFDYQFGLDEKLVHRPAEGDRGIVTHYYCVAKTKDGGVVFQVMSRREVELHRDRYAKKVNGQIVGPWASHFDEMALKTVFKKVFTWLPMTTELALAAGSDEGRITRLSVDDEGDVEREDEDVIDAEVIDTETGEVTAYDRGE